MQQTARPTAAAPFAAGRDLFVGGRTDNRGGSTGPRTRKAHLPPVGSAVIKWQTSTPNSDGSIVHVVQAGQTLVGIATVYQLPLNDLLEMNGLTMQSIIQPDDRITVKRANPTSTVTVSATPTTTATATRRPSPSPSRLPTQALQPTATVAAPVQSQIPGADLILVAILLLVVAGLVLLIWGWLIQRKKLQ